MNILDNPERLPERLHGHREALGLTRIQLAEIMIEGGVDRTVKGLAAQLWFWETCRRQPLLHQLAPWLAALGLRLAITPAREKSHGVTNQCPGCGRSFRDTEEWPEGARCLDCTHGKGAPGWLPPEQYR
jgi:hypothetical protein